MRAILIAVLLLCFAVDAADARKRRHHRYYNHGVVVVPYDARGAFDRRLGADPRALRGMPRAVRGGALTLADVVPSGWQLQPPDPNWTGKQFISPDGSAWFAAYSIAADGKAISEHMKTIAFVDGETITHLQGERTWVAVSGFKDSRIFYRKAMLACAGKTWRNIAFEYPAELKGRMDQFVILAGQILVASQADCEETVSAGAARP